MNQPKIKSGETQSMRHYIFQRKNLIPFLLLMASCGLAVAQSVTASNMLDAANSGTDLAGRVLAEAFGETFYKTPGLPGSGSGTTLGTMFGTFNAALLAVGIFWFAYNVTAATVQTAEGGEFMGQRFSTIWFPIRFIVGISTLVPMFGGYCGAQVIMMYSMLTETERQLIDALGVLVKVKTEKGKQ